MSSSTDSYYYYDDGWTPSYTSTSAPTTVSVPAAPGWGVGSGAVAVAEHLWSEYTAARDELVARQERQQAERAERAQRWASQQAEALALAGRSAVTSDLDATLVLVTQGLRRLRGELSALATPAPAAVAECERLWAGLAAGVCAEALLDGYLALAREVATRAADQPRATRADQDLLATRLAEDRVLVAQGLAGEPALHDDFEERLDRLSWLAATQRLAAEQALEQFERNLQRALRAQSERQARREQHQALADTLRAQLRAVLAHRAEAPEAAGEARVVLADIDRADLADARSWPALEQRTAAAFLRCSEALTAPRAPATAEVAATVRDVLLLMGYQASILPPDRGAETVVAPLDADTGVEFQIAADGHLQTELVGLAEGVGAPADSQHVCTVVDQVFKGLRERHLQVRERARRNLPAGRTLRAAAPRATGQPHRQRPTEHQRRDEQP